MTSNDARLLIQVSAVFAVLVVLILLAVRGVVIAMLQSPGVTAKTIANMKELSDQVKQLTVDRERDHETILQLYVLRERDHETMVQFRVEMEEWKAYGRMLASLLRKLDQDVPPAPAARPPVTQANQVDDRALAQVIASLFDMTEIDDLTFQLGIKDGEIGGETKGAKARNLVNYARRHGMTEELVALAQRERPEGKFI